MSHTVLYLENARSKGDFALSKIPLNEIGNWGGNYKNKTNWDFKECKLME